MISFSHSLSSRLPFIYFTGYDDRHTLGSSMLMCLFTLISSMPSQARFNLSIEDVLKTTQELVKSSAAVVVVILSFLVFLSNQSLLSGTFSGLVSWVQTVCQLWQPIKLLLPLFTLLLFALVPLLIFLYFTFLLGNFHLYILHLF